MPTHTHTHWNLHQHASITDDPLVHMNSLSATLPVVPPHLLKHPESNTSHIHIYNENKARAEVTTSLNIVPTVRALLPRIGLLQHSKQQDTRTKNHNPGKHFEKTYWTRKTVVRCTLHLRWPWDFHVESTFLEGNTWSSVIAWKVILRKIIRVSRTRPNTRILWFSGWPQRQGSFSQSLCEDKTRDRP